MMGGVNAVSPSTSVGFVEDYAAAVERFAVAVGWADLRARVPACPGWTVYDLVVHLGNVHAWASTIVETGQRAVEQNDEPRSTKARSVREWYFAKAEDLYQVLRHTPSQKPCWNFVFGSGVVQFWQRRQLHETTIHQVDLDLAVSRTPSLSPGVAADGVGEVLTVMLPRMLQRGRRAVLDAPLQLTASDTGDSWVVVPAEPARVPTQSSGPPVPPPRVEHHTRVGAGREVRDRVEAPADVLYRALWHREVDERDLRVSGDQARVQAFLASRLTP
jgi:uncharacterized protein (TIGR03083 family)